MDPWGDETFTTSPWAMPSFAAASAGTSTQASHTDWVIVSGVSCSQELTALRPS